MELETPLPWDAADPLLDAEDLLGWKRAIRRYGEHVLDELDAEGLGDRDLVGSLFGEIVKAIGKNFLPAGEVERRMDFSSAPPESSA
jgi:hypothetical protein